MATQLHAATAEGQVAERTDGAHLVIEALQANGIHTTFGLVGIPITDGGNISPTSTP